MQRTSRIQTDTSGAESELPNRMVLPTQSSSGNGLPLADSMRKFGRNRRTSEATPAAEETESMAADVIMETGASSKVPFLSSISSIAEP